MDFLWLRSICVLSGVTHTCARTSRAPSSTKEQNTRPTLITHFSHLNKACLTPSISSTQTPRGIHRSLHSCLPLPPSTSLSPTSCYPTSVSRVGFYFYFFGAARKSGTRRTLFLKSIIMLHCEDTRCNQLSHLENGACTIKLKCFASVDQMDAALFPAAMSSTPEPRCTSASCHKHVAGGHSDHFNKAGAVNPSAYLRFPPRWQTSEFIDSLRALICLTKQT